MSSSSSFVYTSSSAYLFLYLWVLHVLPWPSARPIVCWTRPLFAVSAHPEHLRPSASGPALGSGSCCPLGAAEEPPDSVTTHKHTQNVISHTFTDLIFCVLKLKPSAWRWQWYCDTIVVLLWGDSQWARRGKLKIMRGKSVRWWPAEAKRGQLALVRLTPALNSFSHLLKSTEKRSVWLISRAFSRVEQSWVGRYLHFCCSALP